MDCERIKLADRANFITYQHRYNIAGKLIFTPHTPRKVRKVRSLSFFAHRTDFDAFALVAYLFCRSTPLFPQ